MDPFHALADVVLGVYKEGKAQRWFKLLFTLGFSAMTTFLYVTGGSLAATRSWPVSIGSGMVSSAVILTVLFRRSDLTKGMIVALPEDEAKTEVNTDIQVIKH
jgi:hypothetical protein